ncbi:hypothetical protein KA183_07820 [bacterium]|nr:hypothetical protein [bacterium]QQR58371.1 MAG: hypothetical protein IPG59_02425 [Candidatus Melainabacteria bacterium]
MSIDLNVYLDGVPSDWIQQVTRRLVELGLECEVHPDYQSEYETHDGYLPVRIKLLNSGPTEARGKSYLTGFECAFSEFEYAEELKEVRNPPKPNFVQKLLFKQVQAPGREYIKDEPTDDLLQSYSKVFAINYHHESQILIANAFAAALTELVSGLFNDPQGDVYLPAKIAIEAIPTYMEELPVNEMVPFEGWDE